MMRREQGKIYKFMIIFEIWLIAFFPRAHGRNVLLKILILFFKREDKTVEDCCDVIMKCVETLREFYPAAKLWVSAILPRLDDDQPRARQINDLVRKKSTEYMRDEVQYINFSPDFVKDGEILIKLYRYDEGHEDDKEWVRYLKKCSHSNFHIIA